jgi:hypothetical protein
MEYYLSKETRFAQNDTASNPVIINCIKEDILCPAVDYIYRTVAAEKFMNVRPLHPLKDNIEDE